MTGKHLGVSYEIVQGKRITVYIAGVEQAETFMLFSNAYDYAIQTIDKMKENKQ